MFPSLFLAFVLVSSMFSIAYGAFVLFLVAESPVNAFLGIVFFLLSIAVAAFNAVGAFYYYAAARLKQQPVPPLPKKLPKIAVVVPACNEDPEMVIDTVVRLKKLRYPNKNLLEYWLLDNSTDSKIRARLKRFCSSNSIRYVWRDRRKGFKAGSLNNFLSLANADFLAVFDADEKLSDPNFLVDNIGFFRNSRLAFVQTVKRYRPSSLFANAVEATYSFFYNFVQPVRSISGIAMYCGSLGIVRISALREVGGFPEDPPTPTEDTAFAFNADLAGWQGIYVKKTYALGEPVENFSTFVRQQWKYVYGNARLFYNYLDHAGEIHGLDHVHYLTQMFGFPFMSLVFLLFAVLSAGFVLSNLSYSILEFWKPLVPISAQIGWMQVLPIAMNFLSVLVVSRVYFGSFKTGVVTALLNFALAFKRSEAALSASSKDPMDIWVTAKSKIFSKPSLFQSLKATWMESAYSTFFLLLAIISLARGDLAGAFWLFWYSVLFYSSLALAYFYN